MERKVYYKKLRKFIKGQGMSFKEYADKVLHLNPMTLTYKFTGRLSFTLEDIKLTQKYFNLSPLQVDEFFLHERFTK